MGFSQVDDEIFVDLVALTLEPTEIPLMTLESSRIEAIYAGKVASRYDRSMSHFFAGFKRRAFADTALKPGNRVLVFCCGTGLDFAPILEKIGEGGSIVGIDFSAEMLSQAQEKLEKNHLENVQLIQADVTRLDDTLDRDFDAGVCTLGMSIIPDYRAAYTSLLTHVRSQGEIVIGDMKLASGWRARLNPLTLHLAKRFGGTPEGHQNSVELISLMERDLTDLRRREFFFGGYFTCVGRTP